MAGFRKLKNQILDWLRAEDWLQRLANLEQHPPRQLVGPLFSLLLHGDVVRWRAVTALGLTIARLADQRMEEARIVMRRFIWNLSEESGNLGWGAPEAMGEAMARHEGLAREYNRCLISYILRTDRDDNFMDHLPLRRGAYWGVARLAEARPEAALPALESLVQGLQHPKFAPEDLHEQPDPEVHGLCAWALGSLAASGDTEARTRLREVVPLLGELEGEQASFPLYRDGEWHETTVGALAREALQKIAQA